MRTILSKLLPSRKSGKESQSNKDLLDNFVILPETIRYAMNYKQAQFNYEEIESLLYPSFGLSGLYMMMKFHDNNPPLQLSMLSYLAKHHDDLDLLYKELSGLHTTKQSSHTVKGSKIASLSRYNFNGLDKNFETIANKCNHNHKTPIVLLYAGLLSLPSLLKDYHGDHIRLFNPKTNNNQSFKLTRKGNKRTVSHTILNNISDDHVFVDDIYNTGKSYNKALNKLQILGHQHTLDIYTALDTNNSTTRK